MKKLLLGLVVFGFFAVIVPPVYATIAYDAGSSNVSSGTIGDPNQVQAMATANLCKVVNGQVQGIHSTHVDPVDGVGNGTDICQPKGCNKRNPFGSNPPYSWVPYNGPDANGMCNPGNPSDSLPDNYLASTDQT